MPKPMYKGQLTNNYEAGCYVVTVGLSTQDLPYKGHRIITQYAETKKAVKDLLVSFVKDFLIDQEIQFVDVSSDIDIEIEINESTLGPIISEK